MVNHNNNRINSLAKNTIFYIAGLIITNLILFVSFPILARGLTTGDFGIFDLFTNISILISILLTLGIDSSLARFFHEYIEINKKKKLITEALIIQLASIILFGSLLFFIANFIEVYFVINELYENLLCFSIVQGAFQSLLNFSLSLLKWTSEKGKFIFLSVISSCLTLGPIAFAMNSFNAELQDIFEFMIIGRVISSIIGIYLIKNWLTTITKKFEYFYILLKYSIPIGFACVIEVMIPAIERFSVINIIHNNDQLGQYAAAAKVCSIFYVFIQAFQHAWGPIALSNRYQEKIEDLYSFISKLFVLVVSVIVILLTFFAKIILGIITSQRYEDGYVLIFPLAMSLAFQSVGSITGIGISISLKSHYHFIINLIQIIIFIILLISISDRLGVFGIAIAIMLSSVIKLLIISIVSTYLCEIKWPLRQITYILLITFLIGFVITLLNINFLSGPVWLYIFIVLPIIFYWFYNYSLNLNERDMALNFLKKLNITYR